MIYNAYAEQNQQVSGINLVSCGHIFAKHGREINRPCGREDWLLFYIAKENETFYMRNKVSASAGSFILFAPGEKQHHSYEGNQTAEFYYIHFQCKALPPEISLATSTVYEAPFNRQICDLFDDIIEETLCKQPLYEKLCIYKMLYLLTLLERSVLRKNRPNKESFERIARAVQHMNRHYDSNLSLADYADMCSMSKYHFLRTFEEIIGSTPMEYRNHIRLQHAADLLLEERLTVEQISALVGYSSASYFSSAFKKEYHLSPKQYQMGIR
ncbi:MAG: helix-turn-helix transcriptional regulator [Clostridia bacterium]|nr:helix-turn-helix transcriptional regulator [Clostridia bacterium]